MQWVLRPERIGLIGMNKEGLVSLPGTSPALAGGRLMPSPRLPRDLLLRPGYR